MKSKILGFAAATGLCALTTTAGAAVLTDITVFSSNAEGNNWNSLIWNTQGANTDPAQRWNLYVSADPLTNTAPTFINGFDDSRTTVALPLSPGVHTYSIYGNGVGMTFDPQQNFVLNLYFDGQQAAPGISGVQNLLNNNLAAAGNANGLDIYGNSGQQEAGTLSMASGGQTITLTDFKWITTGERDVVWPNWANDAPYSGGDGALDYYGSFTLDVQSVPEPGTLGLLGLALAGVGVIRKRKAR